MTDSFLVLYGSVDTDVSGDKTDGIMQTGFKFFDDAGTESSYFYNNQAPNKHMIFFYGFDHRIFSEKQSWPEDPNGFASDAGHIFTDRNINN